METGKEKRVLKLEQRQSVSDQKEIFCSCDCHRETLADYDVISNEKAERIWKIIESFGSFQLPDGTWRTVADDLRERIENRPPCTCSCSH